jgi:hypothetical protein
VAQHSRPGKGALRIATGSFVKMESLDSEPYVLFNTPIRVVLIPDHFLQLLCNCSLRISPSVTSPNNRRGEKNSQATTLVRIPRRPTDIPHPRYHRLLEFFKWLSFDLDDDQPYM